MQNFEFEQVNVPECTFPDKCVFRIGHRELGFATLKTDGSYAFVIDIKSGVAYVKRPGRDMKLFATTDNKRPSRGRNANTHHDWCYPALVVQPSGEIYWTLSCGFPNFLSEGFLETDEIESEVKKRVALPLMQIMNREIMGRDYVRRYLSLVIKDSNLRQLIH